MQGASKPNGNSELGKDGIVTETDTSEKLILAEIRKQEETQAIGLNGPNAGQASSNGSDRLGSQLDRSETHATQKTLNEAITFGFGLLGPQMT